MKLKIALRFLGCKTPDLDKRVLEKWRSKLWELDEKSIDSLQLNGDCDLPDWGYSDNALQNRALPKKGADLTICILNVPLEDNYYFRRILENVACVSTYEIAEVLRNHHIPIENLILRIVYSCVLIYARKNHLPPITEIASYTHHETKGCVFDMTGIKTDVVFSCDRPILCDACRVAASNDGVSKEKIQDYESELAKIVKRLFYRMTDWVKRRPILTLVISAAMTLILGIVGSLIAAVLYSAHH